MRWSKQKWPWLRLSTPLGSQDAAGAGTGAIESQADASEERRGTAGRSWQDSGPLFKNAGHATAGVVCGAIGSLLLLRAVGHLDG